MVNGGRAERTRSGTRRRVRIVAVAAAVTALVSAAGVATAVAGERSGRRAAADTTASRRPGHPTRPARTTTPAPEPTLVSEAPADDAPSSTGPSPTGPSSTGPSSTGPSSTGVGSASDQVVLPPVNVGFDYQLSTPYPAPSGTRVVTRDRAEAPVPGLYNICYVNAFQTQPDAIDWWRSTHPELLLRRNGAEVADADWGEILLDVSTPEKRSALMTVVGGWIDECAADDFDAVEPDNLDSWTRSSGLLTQAAAVDFAAALATRAHAKGLAIAQKNALELGTTGRDAGLDFAVAEECQEYTGDDGSPECQGYVEVYGAHVVVIEYSRTPFQQACTRFGPTLSVVLRDVNLTAPGSPGYQFATC